MSDTRLSRLKSNLSSSLSRTDVFLRHLSRHLSTYSGIESTLCMFLFTLSFVHSQLSRFVKRQQEKTGLALALQASRSRKPQETIIATITKPQAQAYSRLTHVSSGALSLARACDEFLMFLRLWGLLHIYDWARERWIHPPRDPIIKLLFWTQITAAAIFQGIENTAYLASRGVLAGEHWKARVPRLIALGNKFWMTRQMLEVLRLLRVRQLRWNEDWGAEQIEEKHEDGAITVQSEKLKKQWRRDVLFNVGWLPVRLYASYEDATQNARNPVTDAWFGLAGLVPSWIMLQDAWRASAEGREP